jgi:hypothetical protein
MYNMFITAKEGEDDGNGHSRRKGAGYNTQEVKRKIRHKIQIPGCS